MRLLTRNKASTTNWGVEVAEAQPSVKLARWDAVDEISWGWPEGFVELMDGDGSLLLTVRPPGTAGRVRFASHDRADRFLLQLWPTAKREPDAVLKASTAWRDNPLSPFEQRLARLPSSVLLTAEVVAVRAALSAHAIPEDQPSVSEALDLIVRVIALYTALESGSPDASDVDVARLLEDRTRISSDLVAVFLERLDREVQATAASYPSQGNMEVHHRLRNEPVWRRMQALRALQFLMYQPEIPLEPIQVVRWRSSEPVIAMARAASPETWSGTEAAILALIDAAFGG